MNIVLFDNFFEENFNPDQVRNFGLSQFVNKDLINDDVPYYPGIRTPPIHTFNPNLSDYIRVKILNPINSLCQSSKIKQKEKYNLYMQYHLTTSVHQCGCIHRDKSDFAGVIYLNPNSPKNSGTNLYTLKENYSEKINFIKLNNFYTANRTKDKEIISSFCKEKNEYNQKYFDLEYTLAGKYNSAVLYPSNYWHSPGKYFGEGLEDSRLCIVLFFKYLD